MAFGQILQIIYRRSWLIVGVVVVTLLMTMLRLRMVDPAYEAVVKVQITAPEREDVVLYERARAVDAREELAVLRNNFVELLKSGEVKQRALTTLMLDEDDGAYTVEVRPIRDSDFVHVAVSTSAAERSAALANAHVAAAIMYYGEIRAQPTVATKELLAGQLRQAEQKLREAEAAFNELKLRNNITTMSGEVEMYLSLINRLQEERNTRLIQGPTNWEIQNKEALIEQLTVERERMRAEGNTAMVERLGESIARTLLELQQLRDTTSATANVDSIIVRRREELQSLLLLQPIYTRLEQAKEQGRKEYELLQNKYTEAVLKERSVKAASFIQIVEPAESPERPLPTNQRTLLILAFIGSLGVATILAFGLDYLLGLKVPLPAVGIRLVERMQHVVGHLQVGNKPVTNVQVPAASNISTMPRKQATSAFNEAAEATDQVTKPIHLNGYRQRPRSAQKRNRMKR